MCLLIINIIAFITENVIEHQSHSRADPDVAPSHDLLLYNPRLYELLQKCRMNKLEESIDAILLLLTILAGIGGMAVTFLTRHKVVE